MGIIKGIPDSNPHVTGAVNNSQSMPLASNSLRNETLGLIPGVFETNSVAVARSWAAFKAVSQSSFFGMSSNLQLVGRPIGRSDLSPFLRSRHISTSGGISLRARALI